MIKPFYWLNHSIVFSQFKPFKCIFTIYTIWSNHLEALGHPLKNKKNQKLLSSHQCCKYISIATCFDILKIDIHRPNGRTDVICTSGTSCFLRRICSEKMKGKFIFFRTYLCLYFEKKNFVKWYTFIGRMFFFGLLVFSIDSIFSSSSSSFLSVIWHMG